MIEIRSEDGSVCLGHMSIQIRDGPTSLQLQREPNWMLLLRQDGDSRRRPLGPIEISRTSAEARIWSCASPELLSQCRLFIPSAAYSAAALNMIEETFEDARLRRDWPPEEREREVEAE